MSATTRWSLIRRAAGHDAEARVALTELCTVWRPAVLRYLRRRHDPIQAEDLTCSNTNWSPAVIRHEDASATSCTPHCATGARISTAATAQDVAVPRW